MKCFAIILVLSTIAFHEYLCLGQIPSMNDEHCVWYKVCVRNKTKVKNCAYDGPPKILDSEGVNLLKKWCPNLIPKNKTEDVLTCCDIEQIKDLVNGVATAASILNRCPSCFANFLQPICEFTCSPHQSSFIKVVEKKINTLTNRTFVNEIDLYITEKFINGSYDSCKNVNFPSSGQLAFDLMCGAWGATKCTPKRLFHYWGDESEDFVPFQINYIMANSTDPINGFKPLNPRIVPCNESIDGITSPCSCIDCTSTCPKAPPSMLLQQKFTSFWDTDKFTVFMFLIYLICCVLFVIWSTYCLSSNIATKTG
ncbi:CLUMA_CG014191, isoform A, partial [Clunio marinus]